MGGRNRWRWWGASTVGCHRGFRRGRGVSGGWSGGDLACKGLTTPERSSLRSNGWERGRRVAPFRQCREMRPLAYTWGPLDISDSPGFGWIPPPTFSLKMFRGNARVVRNGNISGLPKCWRTLGKWVYLYASHFLSHRVTWISWVT